MNRFLKIEPSILSQHSSLSATDECYYLFEYFAGGTHTFSHVNDLILNIKKSPDKRGTEEWGHKNMAMDELADELRIALPALINFSNTTIIPIPPSRARSSPLYDDRLLQILYKACPATADIRELILCREDRMAAHDLFERPGHSELMLNYELNREIDTVPAKNVVLFDDIITAGSHYLAGKNFVEKHFPGKNISGLFIARRCTSELVPAAVHPAAHKIASSSSAREKPLYSPGRK